MKDFFKWLLVVLLAIAIALAHILFFAALANDPKHKAPFPVVIIPLTKSTHLRTYYASIPRTPLQYS